MIVSRLDMAVNSGSNKAGLFSSQATPVICHRDHRENQANPGVLCVLPGEIQLHKVSVSRWGTRIGELVISDELWYNVGKRYISESAMTRGAVNFCYFFSHAGLSAHL